jgi:2,4-dienoyl-CoA reductase-like NADH-dependent reductase (Old Yellow Enzyme family)
VLAPSAIAFSPEHPVPTEMDAEDIRRAAAAFAAAAQRALAANFDVVEIHGAHGYLLHSFLSPLTNARTDQYGGTFDNRIRLLCETCEAVRRIWPEDRPLFVRLSVTDWHDDGWQLEDSVALARRLKLFGVDLIDCSSGGILPGVRIPAGPGYQTGFAERLRREAEIATCAVGMITAPEQADTIVRTGQADLVMLAREFLRQPYWPLLAARSLGRNVEWAKQYERAR